MINLSLKTLEKLLALEKERRGIETNELLFIGMADTAKYNWCAMQSVLINREMELAFFGAYLSDRINYSLELGLIDTIPKEKEKLLDIGDEITLDDIEKLLLKRAEKKKDMDVDEVIVIPPSLEKIDSPDKMGILLHILEEGEIPKQAIEKLPSTEAGMLLHMRKSENYPSIRWNFPWRDYVVVGIPDGITDTFVYEFKTTGKYGFLRFVRPVAFAQADLYGYFFRRDKKRVQIYVRGKDKVFTWMERVDTANAIKTLQKFREIDKEGKNPPPPRAWKCKPCRFKEICIIYKTNFTSHNEQ